LALSCCCSGVFFWINNRLCQLPRPEGKASMALFTNKIKQSRVRQGTPIISAQLRPRQATEFEASLGYTVRSCLKTKVKRNRAGLMKLGFPPRHRENKTKP
jgi:hypothetical protein